MEFKEPGIAMVDGRRLAYEEVSPPSPKGTIMLLVGLGAKRQGWYKQLPEFGRSYRTIALDYRDVGDSDEASGPYTIKDLAEDTAAVMRTLEIRQAHIIGISMGGFIALELVLHYPQMVEKLVLVVTSAGGPGHVSPGHEIMAVMMPTPGIEIGEAARKVCAAVSTPGFAESHPEEFDIFAEIARYRPMSEAAYFRSWLPSGRSSCTTGLLKLHYDAPEGRLIVTCSIAFPVKVYNARRHPQVALLFSDPTGAPLTDVPTVLVQGEATVAELEDDPPWSYEMFKESIHRQPKARSFVSNPLARQLFTFQFQRVAIFVQPRRILVWPRGDMIQVPTELEVRYVE